MTGTIHRSSAWQQGSGVSLHVEQSGSGPATIVLLHELGGSLASWDRVIVRLAARHRVVRYDQRGQGWSEKVRAPFTVADHMRDLDAVLAHAAVQAPCVLVGAAAGAAIAVAYALTHPRRIAGLVLCPPALGADPQRRSYLAERSRRAIELGMHAIVDDALANSYPSEIRRDAQAYTEYRARMLACDPVCYAHANLALADADLESRLDELRPPCLVLAGRHDKLRPPAAVRRIADAIAGSRYLEIDSGHLMAIQAPDALAAAILAHTDND